VTYLEIGFVAGGVFWLVWSVVYFYRALVYSPFPPSQPLVRRVDPHLEMQDNTPTGGSPYRTPPPQARDETRFPKKPCRRRYWLFGQRLHQWHQVVHDHWNMWCWDCGVTGYANHTRQHRNYPPEVSEGSTIGYVLGVVSWRYDGPPLCCRNCRALHRAPVLHGCRPDYEIAAVSSYLCVCGNRDCTESNPVAPVRFPWDTYYK